MDSSLSPESQRALVVIDEALEKVYELFTGHDSIHDWLRNMALALFEEARSLPLADSDVSVFSQQLMLNAFENFEANFTLAFNQIQSLDPSFSVDCKKGCWQCCFVHLTVMPHEAIYIAHELEKRLSGEHFATLKKHCATIAERADSKGNRLTVLDYFELCPFLVDKACSVYDFRSLACRSWVSQDVEKCLASHALQNKVKVPQNAMLMCQKEIVYAAHAAFLDYKGLQHKLAGLFIALHYLFEAYDEVAGAWYRGEELPGQIL